MVMAHASRIWRVDFITWKNSLVGYKTKVHVLSFGEDSTCQQWSIDFLRSTSEVDGNICQKIDKLDKALNNVSQATLTHLNTFSYHSGKHIWSAALIYASETSRRLVTGGADGKVAIYDIFLEDFHEPLPLGTDRPSHPGTKNSSQLLHRGTNSSWAIEDVLHRIIFPPRNLKQASVGALQLAESLKTDISMKEGNKKAQAIKDTPNRYAFVARNELLLTTSFGRVLLASIENPIKWKELDLPEKVNHSLRSYSVLLGIPDIGVAFLAGANGKIYIFHSKNVITELTEVNGKPAALFNASKLGDGRLGILATAIGSYNGYLLSVTASATQCATLNETITITLGPNFIVTSVCDARGLLVLGARNGSIAVYDPDYDKKPSKVIPGQQPQSDNAFTSIINIPSTGAKGSSCHFLATSRDGSYSIFSLSTGRGPETFPRKISLCLVHKAFPPLGPMIEAAWFSNSDLMLYGFRDKNFVVWNETKQYEVSSIQCGGAHRSYAYLHNPGAGGAGHFAYTKASRLYINSQTHPSHTVLKLGGHGREIKACASHGDFIATGAEDTVVRIWSMLRDGGKTSKISIGVDGLAGKYGDISLECCAVIEKHTTGIQHLQWSCSSEDYHNLFSAGGNEEFHVWAVSEIPGFGVGVVCEATLTDHSEDHDLRIMGFEITFIPNRRPCKIIDGAPPMLLGTNQIILIYSDSTIKCYDYTHTLGFQKTAQSKYTSACLSQITLLDKSGGLPKLPKFFTGSTDGHLALWEFPSYKPTQSKTSNEFLHEHSAAIPTPELNLISCLKLHQSSITALALQHLTLISKSGALLIATGGDDNALSITFLYKLQPVKCITIPSAHAAGIAAVAFKSDFTGGMAEGTWCQLWSVGGDQRVKRWTVEFGEPGENPEPTMENGLNMRVWVLGEEDDVWCSVADPGGCVTWRDNWAEDRCLVFGNGMEIFRLRDGFPNGHGARWAGFIEEAVMRMSGGEDESEED